jgi:uncharacterized protein
VTDVEVRNNPDRNRYEAWVDGQLAGRSEYMGDDEHIRFVHTVVQDAFEGRGVGSALARGALDDVRRDGTRRVVAQCPFIRKWIEDHPDYQDLLRPPESRAD